MFQQRTCSSSMGMGGSCGIACMLCQPAMTPGPMMPPSTAPALAPPRTLCSGSGLLPGSLATMRRRYAFHLELLPAVLCLRNLCVVLMRQQRFDMLAMIIEDIVQVSLLCSANEEIQGEVTLEAEEQWDLCRRATWAER